MDVEGVERVHWLSLSKNAIGLQFGPSEFEVVAHHSGKMEGLEALRDADEATARDIASEIGLRLRQVRILRRGSISGR